jgi:hypothetical protein
MAASNTKETNEQLLRDAVVEAYLETGKAQDVKEIATRMGCSESTVRKTITKAGGCVSGLRTSQQGRDSFSRDYPGSTSGAHKVWVYSPTLETLRTMVLQLRGSKS